MKHLSIIILIFLACSTIAYSQDTIIQKNGVMVFCKIQKEDSVKVYYTIQRNGNDIKTYLNKSDVADLKYGNTDLVLLDKFSFGLGLGMDYGGIGANILVYPQTNFGLFAGLGYPLAGFGYNAGIKLRLTKEQPTSKTHPYIIGMYGYNSAIYVVNGTNYNKLFYGPTVGFGLDLRSKYGRIGFWTLALLIPIRGSDVKNYIDDLQNKQNVNFKSKLLPVGVSIGYRFIKY
jgi:hypothetical protein